MDVERTMQFILESQARAEIRMDRAEARMDKAEARMDKSEARFEKRINAITKLIQTGMKMLVKLEENQADLQKSLKELAASQKVTDRKLTAFLDSLKKGGNGRGRRAT